MEPAAVDQWLMRCANEHEATGSIRGRGGRFLPVKAESEQLYCARDGSEGIGRDKLFT